MINNIQYIQLMNEGNSIDFGDLLAAKHAMAALSNGHGGLG